MGEVKRVVATAIPLSRMKIWLVVNETFAQIPMEHCQDLVDSMQCRCMAVLRNKGFKTKS